MKLRRQLAEITAERERERVNAKSTRRKIRVYGETRETATEHCKRWTSAEIALLADKTLDAHVLALKLGRTYYAVQNRRRKLEGKR
jgi:hypothetical protein